MLTSLILCRQSRHTHAESQPREQKRYNVAQLRSDNWRAQVHRYGREEMCHESSATYVENDMLSRQRR